MHIITKGRATIAGRMFSPGTILDLPEAEARPALDDGTAVPWPEDAEAAIENGEGAPAQGGGGGDSSGGVATVAGAGTLV